ncbi:hypothetical protein [Paenibacillus sp. BIHB 4019]|nr:hypothetical protein [Paenibacillus sp. BIHB 4019]
MQDWMNFSMSVMNLVTAAIVLTTALLTRPKKKKGTKRRAPRKR